MHGVNGEGPVSTTLKMSRSMRPAQRLWSQVCPSSIGSLCAIAITTSFQSPNFLTFCDLLRVPVYLAPCPPPTRSIRKAESH